MINHLYVENNSLMKIWIEIIFLFQQSLQKSNSLKVEPTSGISYLFLSLNYKLDF